MTFEEFASSRLPALLRFAKVLCVDAGLAEDVVQEVLTKSYRRWSAIQEMTVPEAYVRRMIVNEFLSWRRKWARVSPMSEVPEPPAAPDHAGDHAERQDLFARLVVLPPRQRAAIVLRYYADMSDEQIAAELGCAVATVRSIVFRALAALRVQMSSPELLTECREV